MITHTKFLYKWVPGFYRLYHWSKTSALLSEEGKKRLRWFDYYRKCQSASQTCRYFGISRKTFYYWKKRYDPKHLLSLEAKPCTPKTKRQRQITPLQMERIVALRKQYLQYGKEKLAWIYQQTYAEKISSWKIQKVIEKKQLYANPKKTARIARKRKSALKKKRITELKKKKQAGFLVCLDVIVIYWNGWKRYIFTAIDAYSKLAYAWMYSSKSSTNAQEFLYRLYYLLEGNIQNISHDNGSEFQKHFASACQELHIPQYYSRVKTPKDNAVNERFNRTLQHEFLEFGNFTPEVPEFNQSLTEWLIEYNFKRPHQTLGYMTPIDFGVKYLKVLPRYPSNTVICDAGHKQLYSC